MRPLLLATHAAAANSAVTVAAALLAGPAPSSSG
jgi:hypothetical protein